VACDALVPAGCALPWPSDLYLPPDPATVTGVDLAFHPEALPANTGGVRMDPALFDGLDGYGLGSSVLFDLGPVDTTELPDEWTGLEASVGPDSPSLLLKLHEDGTTEPVPHWIEPDRTASEEATLLTLRPAVVLDPASRYAVVLRGLSQPDGSPVARSAAFAALVDGTDSGDAGIEARRERFAALFAALEGADIDLDEVVLAWDFTTASEAALHGRLDSALDAALAADPDGAVFVQDGELAQFAAVEDDSGLEVKPHSWLHVHGHVQTPAVVAPAAQGSIFTLNLDTDAEAAPGSAVTAEGTFSVPFIVHVPHAALDGEGPLAVVLYGHGMFGDRWEVLADHLEELSDRQRYVMVGIPLTGMSSPDGENMPAAILDLNDITLLTDGLHQGIVDHHMVARAVRSGRLAAMLQELDPRIEVDADELHWFGASQGGIFGSTILATSPDMDRGVLAVPGNNYAMMLSRSVNFAPFFDILKVVYPDDLDRATTLAAVQLLWDRTDPVSYQHRLFAEDSGKEALLLVSKGDKQVAVVSNEIAARTFPERLPAIAPYDAERSPWGVTQLDAPRTGSGMVLFDFGNAWPTDRGNLPPEDELPDPHSRIAEVEPVATLLDTFLRTGEILEVCGGDGCTPD
jgi:hypothetical protein